MLHEDQIRYVIGAAMSKYAAENDGRKGLDKKDVIPMVMFLGGDMTDVGSVMYEAMKSIAGDIRIRVS